jgi:L-seryl-tRNA(Ser) seleniumtransferase
MSLGETIPLQCSHVMASPKPSDPRRRLPPVDRVLASPEVEPLVELYGRELVTVQARSELARRRQRLATGEASLAGEDLVAGLRRSLEEAVGPPLRRVLNATGILIHTNLGRAPLPRAVADSLPPLLDASCDLEVDLVGGRRGDRNWRAERLLSLLTGAPAAVVTNNNAAALLLALATLASGREVVVSRGELVEIGGSFRIPDILRSAGARLVEVGTTNRTRLDDFARAVGPETALLLKVHPSNYRIVGFVESVAPPALVALGKDKGVPVMVDEGAGLLRPRGEPQLADHPSLSELVAAGLSLVCASGDKLLGGPQAGLLLGDQELVELCRRHPLYRAVRPDRMALAALDGVLRRHLAGDPFPLDGLWPHPEAHRRRLESAARELGAEIVPADAFVGGGAAPEAPVPGHALALPGSNRLLDRLRSGDPPVMGYLEGKRLLLDLRTVDPEDDALLVAAARRALIEPEDTGAPS